MKQVMRRATVAPGWENLIHDGGSNKWWLSANVMPDNFHAAVLNFRVSADVVMDEYDIEITIPISPGIKDFIGHKNFCLD